MKELTKEMVESYINKSYDDSGYVIHCDTEKKAKILFDAVFNRSDSEYVRWNEYKENMCYFIYYDNYSIDWNYACKDFYKNNGYKTIIEFDSLVTDENSMYYNLEEGYIELSGKRIKLTEEQVAELIEKDNPYKSKDYCRFYYTSSEFDVVSSLTADSPKYDSGNYCRSKELKTQDSLHDLLRSKLRQFSMLNDGLDLDWNDFDKNKYYIYYSYYENNMYVGSRIVKSNDIYFNNIETAQKAIDEVVIPFKKEHPEFVW